MIDKANINYPKSEGTGFWTSPP